MTATKVIITIVLVGILTITAGLFEMSQASDYDCLNLEISSQQLFSLQDKRDIVMLQRPSLKRSVLLRKIDREMSKVFDGYNVQANLCYGQDFQY